MNWDELKQHELTVYSTPWCADCHRLKRVLREKGVAFTEIDIDADPVAAAHLHAVTGKTAIPFIQIDGGPMVRGWHREAPSLWSEECFFAETAEALREHTL